MADYFPLVRKAVAGLGKNTDESRRFLYERARTALAQQLRGMRDPPLTEAEITCERLALEEAIRSVEAEAAGAGIASTQDNEATDVLAELARLITQNDSFPSKADEREGLSLNELEALERAARRARKSFERKELSRKELEVFERTARKAREAFKREARQKNTLIHLSEAASPQPTITPDGRLDAGPNPIFDIPAVDDDLLTLPIRQRTIIKVIVNELPANAPKHLRRSLRAYDEELKVRGVQPILGLLKDMAGIIEAAVAAPDAEDEWLPPGLRQAFTTFAENHTRFVDHFPLDPQREELYATTRLDENGATGQALSEPFERVAQASADAHKVGLATDDFLAVMDKMTEFARVLATQPPTPAKPQGSADNSDRRNGWPQPAITVTEADRIQPVSVKKRTILSGLGFFERAYNLAGTTAQLAGPPEGNAILEALRWAIRALSRLLI